MIGFEIYINSETKKASLENGILSINLNRIKTTDQDKIDFSFGGYDPDSDKSFKWIEKSLSEGDKITIEVKIIEENSNPIEIKKRIPSDVMTEGKLRAYYALKKELEEKGLV